jgi:DNA-binding PadR family transcriptional regulator
MDTPIESKSQVRELTTTSYGVLSVLSLGEHSSYELARQMKMSLHYFWPRAESNVYAESKRLVAAGLAATRTEWNGGRKRTVYSITDPGRAALVEWLAEGSSPQRYETEALLKVFFAENGTRDDLLRAIRELRDEARTAIEHFQRIADIYARGEGAYPDRFALSAITARLLIEQQAATVRWATWAERNIAAWDSACGRDAAWGVRALRGAHPT